VKDIHNLSRIVTLHPPVGANGVKLLLFDQALDRLSRSRHAHLVAFGRESPGEQPAVFPLVPNQE
jgi:hypothetical protein